MYFYSIFRVIFFRKSVLGKLEVHFLLLSNTGANLTTICILKHSNVLTDILTLKLNPAFTDFILLVIMRSLKIALQWRSQPLIRPVDSGLQLLYFSSFQ